MAGAVPCNLSIQTEDFDLAELYARLRARGSGACVLFTGTVRQFNDAGEVLAIELEHYSGMTEESIRRTVDKAADRWDIDRVEVVHRVGRLAAGEQIVLVGVASAHRHSAFEACEYIMDYLKTEAPIWKKEISGDGERWVEAKSSDHESAARWEDGSSGRTPGRGAGSDR